MKTGANLKTSAKLKTGLIQMSLKASTDRSPGEIRQAMLDAHTPLIDDAGKQGVQVLCFQEVFTQPYFCPSQDTKWYAAAEAIPDGPTTKLMQEYAKKYSRWSSSCRSTRSGCRASTTTPPR